MGSAGRKQLFAPASTSAARTTEVTTIHSTPLFPRDVMRGRTVNTPLIGSFLWPPSPTEHHVKHRNEDNSHRNHRDDHHRQPTYSASIRLCSTTLRTRLRLGADFNAARGAQFQRHHSHSFRCEHENFLLERDDPRSMSGAQTHERGR